MVNKSRLHPSVCVVLCLVLLSARPLIAEGAHETSSICEQAAFVASRDVGVPLDVLRAIALTETGTKKNGRFLAWPWTVNMEGDGRWFASRRMAYEFAETHRLAGASSFDVGCFQINFRWHKAAFSSLDAMFDPFENAVYAARFLRSLYEEMGDWTKAVGAYHSRTPRYATKYIARYQRIRANLDSFDAGVEAYDAELQRVSLQAEEGINSFPFLKPVDALVGQASLVPLADTAGAGRFISIANQ